MSGCIAVAILSLFCYTLEQTGVHIDNRNGATDYTWESNQIRTNTSEGFSWTSVDKYGFNNTDENTEQAMTEGVDILLMGSSHMDAMQVSEGENVGAILNEKLPELNTYNIGMSGHDIYRIFDNAYAAVETYQPQEYLLMEIDEIKLDINKMQAVIDGTAKKIPSYDSGIIYKLQKIPAIKWIYKSLDDWMNQSKSAFENVYKSLVKENKESSVERYKTTLMEFLELCVEACKQTGCKPIIFYHQQADILQNGSVKFDTDEKYLDIFTNACEQKEIIFIDMNPVFAKEYEKEQVLPHGFINSYVGNGHLNEHGHRMIVKKLLESDVLDK